MAEEERFPIVTIADTEKQLPRGTPVRIVKAPGPGMLDSILKDPNGAHTVEYYRPSGISRKATVEVQLRKVGT
jgi:hypothetical protein